MEFCHTADWKSALRSKAPLLFEIQQPMETFFWSEIFMQQPAVRPEMAADICQIPITDRLEFRLAVAQRVNGFEPVSLHDFGPETMPSRHEAFGTHAGGIDAIGGVAGNFRDVE